MALSVKSSAMLLLALSVCAMRPVAAAEPVSTVTSAGITLRSVGFKFPHRGQTFPGTNSDAINNNCLACHSAGMVLTQPALSRADWQAEVAKMRNTYKAPIADADVPAIVDYLVSLNPKK
jgi:cytochrome c5